MQPSISLSCIPATTLCTSSPLPRTFVSEDPLLLLGASSTGEGAGVLAARHHNSPSRKCTAEPHSLLTTQYGNNNVHSWRTYYPGDVKVPSSDKGRLSAIFIQRNLHVDGLFSMGTKWPYLHNSFQMSLCRYVPTTEVAHA